MTTTIPTDIQKFDPGQIVEMFVIDASNLPGGSTYYFYNGTLFDGSTYGSVVWQGQTYAPLPMSVTGFEFSGNGTLPRPKVQISNVSGVISGLVLAYTDLVGAKVTRKRTFAKYLDGMPGADSTAGFPDDIYYIDRKTAENKIYVEWELSSSFDVQGVRLPSRQIVVNSCQWAYRSSECSYAGTNYFDANDNPVTSSSQDVCAKRLTSCKARFGSGNLPFGAFPAASLG